MAGNPGLVNQTKKVLEGIPGIDRILDDEDKKRLKVNHERSGEIIAICEKDKWFSYYWWYKQENAPNFARNVDIHRKPGYDPLELFLEPSTKSISQNTSLLKGSHGRPADPVTGEGLALFVSSRKSGNLKNIIDADHIKCVDVGKYLVSLVS